MARTLVCREVFTSGVLAAVFFVVGEAARAFALRGLAVGLACLVRGAVGAFVLASAVEAADVVALLPRRAAARCGLERWGRVLGRLARTPEPSTGESTRPLLSWGPLTCTSLLKGGGDSLRYGRGRRGAGAQRSVSPCKGTDNRSVLLTTR